MTQQIQWSGKWIWTKGATNKPFHVSYFRCDFHVSKACRESKIYCCADSKYRLWVNGGYIGFGPARGHPKHPYYDTRIVPLKAGRNSITFMVQHLTGGSSIYAAVEGGLICQVEAGGEIVAATDKSWRAISSRAYAGIDGFIFPEKFDARNEPAGWQNADFDPSDWPAAVELRNSKLAPPQDLLPRPIPLLTEKRLDPKTLIDTWRYTDIAAKKYITEKDVASSLWHVQQDRLKARLTDKSRQAPQKWSGRPIEFNLKPRQASCLILDFGFETLASPELSINGPAGAILDIGYSECLDDDLVPTLWQGIRQSERIITRAGLTKHRINQPRGFRFMIIRAANVGGQKCRISLNDVSAHEAIYPARPTGEFKCSDELLNRIFSLASRTVNLCMEDAYTDCPWRERSQWIGDAQPETLFSYYSFGAYELARKAVLEFTSGNTDEGWIPGVFPISSPFNLPTWGMRVPVIAWEYFLYSGDRTALPDMYAGVKKQMAWLARYEDLRGLLIDLPGWCFVDWTKPDGGRNDGAVQGWYLEALENSAMLAAEAGEDKDAANFRIKADRLRKSLARAYWSEKRGAFLKYRTDSGRRPPEMSRDLIGQHENFLFSLLDVGTPGQRRLALQAIAGPTGKFLPNLGDYQSIYRPDGQHGNTAGSDGIIRIGTPFWSYYALLALLKHKLVREAMEYMRLCWGLMLEHGATSCWEMWDRHTSHCHGWSAAPAMILPAYVLGVKPIRPGFELFEVRPHIGDIKWARGQIPTPGGIIRIEWKNEENKFVLKLTVPKGTSAKISPPSDNRTAWRFATVDGKSALRQNQIVLSQGAHQIVFLQSK